MPDPINQNTSKPPEVPLQLRQNIGYWTQIAKENFKENLVEKYKENSENLGMRSPLGS